VRKVVETAREAYGPVEVLVSNTGFLQQQPFVDLIVGDFDRMISVHSRGAFLCIHAVLPEMLPAGRRSSVKSGAYWLTNFDGESDLPSPHSVHLDLEIEI
jgi:NAD(P)-dependent dehydrogenase (short-subunit alcohol dehydrogenase family)